MPRPARSPLLSLLFLLLLLPSGARPAPLDFPRTQAARKALLQSRARQEVEALLKAVSQDELIALGREAIRELGVYSARLRKQERVRGRLLDAQVSQITVREAPYAVRMEVVEGPKKGRKVLYNEQLRKGELRVREAGLLGMKALWLDLDSSLARRDTHHPVTDLGFGPILRHLSRDQALAAPLGAHRRQDEGFDARGRWCLTFVAPPGAENLHALRTRMCLDLLLGLPVELEAHDAHGLLERLELTDVRPNLAPPPDHFSPQAMGL
jgi:hypothetical protein